MEALVALVLAAGLFVGVPTAMWLRSRDEARRRWLPRVVGTTRVGDEGYRGAEIARLGDGGPSRLVHVTAMLCWILGTMFLPGLAAGLLGILAMGVGIVSIPGLILAARLFALGGPLLRGEAAAAAKARSAAGFARVLNAVVLAVLGGVTAVQAPEILRHGVHGDTAGLLALSALIALYAGVSLAHAKMLGRAAQEIDDEVRRRTGLASAESSRTGVRLDAGDALDAGEGFEAEVLAEAEAVRRRG